MLVILCLLFALAASGLEFKWKGWCDPFERDATACVKGLFICLVFLSHISGYLLDAGSSVPGDKIVRGFLGILGQMLVAMFFVYSGYGVMKSILAKGDTYVRAIPVRRIFRTLFRFDIAVCAFLLLNVVLGTRPDVGKIALSLVAWDSLGNSNWYIFAVVLCYFVTWVWALAFRSPAKPGFTALSSLVGVFALCIVALSFVKERWWYDTMMAYPLGCIIAAKKERIKDCFRKYYWLLLPACAAGFVALLKIVPDAHGLVGNSRAVVFGLLVVLLTMKVRLTSWPLRWMGRNLFALYIYQRLPMIAFASVAGGALLSDFPVGYIGICVVATLAIAWCAAQLEKLAGRRAVFDRC